MLTRSCADLCPVYPPSLSQAYDRNPSLSNLLVDPKFAEEVAVRDAAWRRVVSETSFT
jgi:6-phosphogluconate dehydrogenase